MQHLRLGRLNGDELMPQLMELAHMVKDGKGGREGERGREGGREGGRGM